jgi:hypothetical protein
VTDSGRVIGVHALFHREVPAGIVLTTVAEHLDRIARTIPQLSIVVLRRDGSVDEVFRCLDGLIASLGKKAIDGDAADPRRPIDIERS